MDPESKNYLDEQMGQVRRDLVNKLFNEESEGVREQIARLDERVKKIETMVGNGKEPVFISRAEFAPVRAIVYGLVGLIMTGIVVALLATVVQHGR